MIFCARTQEGEKLIVPGTERHACLLEVRIRTYIRLRRIWVFNTRENALLARLTRKMVPITGGVSSFLVKMLYVHRLGFKKQNRNNIHELFY